MTNATKTTCTKLEALMLRAIRDEECNNGDPLAETWNQSAMMDFVALGGERSQAGGVVASLVAKGWVGTTGHGRDDGIWLTQAGLDVIGRK